MLILIRSGATWSGSMVLRVRYPMKYLRHCFTLDFSGKVSWAWASHYTERHEGHLPGNAAAWFRQVYISILRHSGIWGAADKTVLNTVHKKTKFNKNYLKAVLFLWWPPNNIISLFQHFRILWFSENRNIGSDPREVGTAKLVARLLATAAL
jgi:hypothetical protein